MRKAATPNAMSTASTHGVRAMNATARTMTMVIVLACVLSGSSIHAILTAQALVDAVVVNRNPRHYGQPANRVRQSKRFVRFIPWSEIQPNQPHTRRD